MPASISLRIGGRPSIATCRQPEARPGTGAGWILAAAAVLVPLAAQAGTFYVDNQNPSASDANPGGAALPYRTISAAVAAHGGAGVIILVNPGVYRETVTAPASGDSTSPCVFRAASSGVIVDGSDDFSGTSQWTLASGAVYLAAGVGWSPLQVFVDGARLTPSSVAPPSLPANSFEYVAGAGLYVNLGGGNPGAHTTTVGRRTNGFKLSAVSYVQVDGFTVTRTEDKAVYLTGASHCVVRNCTVTFSRKYGIHVAGGAFDLIEKNQVSDNQYHGIGLLSGVTSSTVQDNECFRNADPATRIANGLYVGGASGNLSQRNRYHDNQDSGEQISAAANNNLEIQNVSWNNGDRGFDHLDSQSAVMIGCVASGNANDGFSFDGASTGGQLVDCIAVNNGVATGRFDLWVGPQAASGFQSDYNLLWNSAAAAPIKFVATTYATVAAFSAVSGTDLHTLQLDPRFANPAGGDFHLLAGSPAIDDANSGLGAWPATDAGGQSRVDDPLTPNAGVGPVAYADRGAYEYQPPVPVNQPPDGTIDSPAANVTVAAGQAVDFTCTGTDPDSNPPLHYAWSFGGGAPASTVQDPGPVLFDTPGTYTVSLTVTDGLGLPDPTPATRVITVTPAPAGVADDEIHWTFTGQNSVTLDWRGFDRTVRYGLTTAYGGAVTAATPAPIPFSSPGPFWQARITGLQENTVYHYAIGSGPDHTFHTPLPRGSSGFTVWAQGDIGASNNFPTVTTQQATIAAQPPDFALMIGDLTYGNDESQASVDQHFNDVMVWSQDAAYMPVWGNHEWDNLARDDLRNYAGRFDLPNAQSSPGSPTPNAEDWSWFDYGNVRFISYPEPYASSTWPDWSTRAAALMDQAQADPAIRFIVTFGHRPAYSSGYHGDNGIRQYLDALGASHSKYVLNLNGHSHDYERSYPQSGVVHITSGTGGADLEPVSGTCIWGGGCPPPAWSAYRAMHFVTLRLHFSAAGILGEALCGPSSPVSDITCTPGTVIDRFVIGTLDQPPVVTAPGAVTANEGGTLTLNVSAVDPDGPALASLTASGLPPGATFSAAPGNASGTLSWTPSFTQAGTYPVTFTAANTSSGSATTTVTVRNVDRAPAVTAPVQVSGVETTPLAIAVAASDPDGDPIASLVASGLPPGAAFGANPGHTGGTLSWTPAYGAEGTYVVSFIATNALADTATTTITVRASGAPVVTAPATATAAAGSLLTVNVTAYDPNHKAIDRLSASGLPSGASFAPGPRNTTGTLSWTPTVAEAGTCTVTFLAENALSGSATTIITATRPDRPPVVTAPPAASGQAGVPLTVSVTAMDPDRDAIASLTASGLPGAAFAAASGNTAGTLAWTPGPADTGSRVVTFTATNALAGAAGTTITIRPPNRPPVAVLSIAPPSGIAPLRVMADATGSSDPDGSIASYRFDFGDGAVAGPQPGASAAHTYAAGTWRVTVTVTDNQGATAVATGTVSVGTSVNQANLVGNPSFETNLNNWGADSGDTLSRVAGGFDGSWALQMAGPRNLAGFGCNDVPNWVSAVPAAGNLYRCSAWVRSATSGGIVKLQVREYSGGLRVGGVFSTGVTLSSAWQLVTVDYTSVAAGSTLDFQVLDFPLVAGEVFLTDAISIVDITAASSSEVGVGDPPDGAGRPPLVGLVSPSPLRDTSILSFVTTRAGPLRVTLFDLGGRRVRCALDDPRAAAGMHQVTIDGRDERGRTLGSGLYFYRIRALEGVSSGRILIAR